MEVLSNKEIYVLLKILKEKNNVKLDKNFTQKELEHLQSEICNAENKTPAEVLTIENTYKKMLGMSLHFGYKINIVSIEIITNYTINYVQALVQDGLSGLTNENKLSLLMEEFYSLTKNVSDYDDYIVNEIKYMPVVLFAYINDLFELKTLSNREYDLRREINGDALFEQLDLRDDEIMIRMNITKLTNILENYGAEGKEVLKYILGNATIVNTEKVRKQTKKTINPHKKQYHMQPKQWKLFFCLLKVAKETTRGQEIAKISKYHLVKNMVLDNSITAQDTAKTRFNDAYNRIKGNKEGEFEDLIYPKVSDTRYYEFSVSKVINLYNTIIKNEYLAEEYKKNSSFFNQIVDYDLPK